MFDIPPPIEQYCPQETTQLVMEIQKNHNPNTTKELFYTQKWDTCLDSTLAFLFSILDGTEDEKYISKLLDASYPKRKLTKKTQNIIYSTLTDIPYIDNTKYSISYFKFLMNLEVEPTNEIKNIEFADTEEYNTKLWYKNLYLSYMNDWDAFYYLLEKLKLEPELSRVVSNAGDFRLHPVDMRIEIMKAFKDDTRTLGSVFGGPGPKLIDALNIVLQQPLGDEY